MARRKRLASIIASYNAVTIEKTIAHYDQDVFVLIEDGRFRIAAPMCMRVNQVYLAAGARPCQD